jgi:hypothetical protein
MKTKMILAIGVISLFCFFFPVSSDAAPSSLLIPFETIAQGDISYYNYGDSGFTGADLLIKFHIIKLKRTGATSVAFDHKRYE